MPDCVHIWREKRAEKALKKEEERAVRLSQLDPERANTSANQDGVEGNQNQVCASAPPPEEQATAPGAGLLSQGSSTQKQ